MSISIIIFTVFSATLILVGIIASKSVNKKNNESYFLNNRLLGKYLVGISAAITGNTGFIITGAVALGFLYGMSALMLPIAWFFGDLLFWLVFPSRLNDLSSKSKSSTISGYLSANLGNTKILKMIIVIIVTVTIAFYTAVQWIAAGITFASFFDISNVKIGILVSGFVVLLYSYKGGLKASVWTDIFQAIFVTFLIIIIFWKAYTLHGSYDNFIVQSNSLSDGFMDLTINYTIFSLLGFIIGWAFASIGFGLSQPQVISRYFAGESPQTVKKAMIIYLFFLQFTWLGLTFFGVYVRVLMPELVSSNETAWLEAQTALPVFASSNFSELTAAVILTGMFAVISSTADSFLIATANSLKVDVLGKWKKLKYSNAYLTLLIGVITIGIALLIDNPSVEKIARNIVTLLGGMIGPAVLIKTLNLKHSSKSLVLTILFSTLVSLIWWVKIEMYGAKYFGSNFIDSLTPTVIAIIVGLITNFIAVKALATTKPIRNAGKVDILEAKELESTVECVESKVHVSPRTPHS